MVNAIPITCFDRARDHAQSMMQKPVEDRGLLAGLPVLIKDLSNVAGVRSTQGSPIFKDYIPEHSDYVVCDLENRRDCHWQVQHTNWRWRKHF